MFVCLYILNIIITTVIVQKIECSNLKSVETFGGKNDVYVVMKWNDATIQTEVHDVSNMF